MAIQSVLIAVSVVLAASLVFYLLGIVRVRFSVSVMRDGKKTWQLGTIEDDAE